jgi:phosphatidylglycerophosphate synthase
MQGLSMLDRFSLNLTKPLLDRFARPLARAGIVADHVSLTGFGIGLLAAILIATGHSHLALVPIILNRFCDGLDGALARQTKPRDRGAFLDISLDFLFYAAIPLAFAFSAPLQNALAAAALLAAFLGTGASFLAYAVIAAKRGATSTAYPTKGFYYLGGLTEGTETIACFVLMCLLPQHFPPLAYIFASLCCFTIATRIIAGWKAFG